MKAIICFDDNSQRCCYLLILPEHLLDPRITISEYREMKTVWSNDVFF
jgi:hypothetical protein